MTPRSHHGKMLDYITDRIHSLKLSLEISNHNQAFCKKLEETIERLEREKNKLIGLIQQESSINK